MSFLIANGTQIFAALWVLSEVLGQVPSIKANNVFQLIVSVLKVFKK
jgi:hypothetical protein